MNRFARLSGTPRSALLRNSCRLYDQTSIEGPLPRVQEVGHGDVGEMAPGESPHLAPSFEVTTFLMVT